MRRSTALFTAAALAVGGMTMPASVFAQRDANTDRSGATAGTNDRQSSGSSGTARENAGQGQRMSEVKGVQELFARATNAAVSENGLDQLQMLIAPASEIGQATGAGAHIRAGDTGAGESGNVGTSGESGRTSGSVGSRGQSGAGETPQAPGEDRRSARGGEGAAGNFDPAQLNQTVQQIRQAWQQKYGKDFKIENEEVVYSDITAAEIGAGEAQPAAGEIRGRESGAAGSSNTSGTDSGNRTERQSTERQSEAGSTGAGTTGAGGHISGNEGTAGARMRGREMTVTVPPVRGGQPLQIHLIKTADDQFKFASMGEVDRQRLGQNLERHLKMVQEHQQNWPDDVNQAYRIVTQHVLMAINDASEGGEHARPAGERQRRGGDANDTGRTSGSSDRSDSTDTGSRTR